MSQNARVQAGEPFNQIDGFTTATPYHHVRVAQSMAFKTYAILTWKEFFTSFNVDSYKLFWGTKKGVYSDTLDLFSHLAPPIKDSAGTQPFTIDTLKNLKENTEYFAEFNMNYNRKLFKEEFRFNTPPLPTIKPCETRILNKTPALTVVRNNIATVELYTLRGEKLRNVPISSSGRLKSGFYQEVLPGSYMVVFKDRERTTLGYKKVSISK